MTAADRPVLWTAAEAAAATGGTAVGDWSATGVSIDSRTLAPGDLFVALTGPNHDGHDHAAAALARGAAAVVAHRPPPRVAPDAPLLAVDNTMDALRGLGTCARLRGSTRIVGVTGSAGKTGTKEALALVLGAQGRTHATAGNLNNHWGVPLSLARMPADAAFGVFELGMNHAGEIAPLSRQVKPDVAIITTVQAAHLENFPSVAAIADAKAEIFAGMSSDGVAVLNRDNPHYASLVAHARTQGIGRIWSFGEHERADARLLDHRTEAGTTVVEARLHGAPVRFTLPVPGRHVVMNSLAVLLAVEALGADPAAAAAALARLPTLKGRGEVHRIRIARHARRGALTVIDESYNANPASVEAAVDVLARAERAQRGRRIAVLGDMLELGPTAPALHAGLAGPLQAAGIETVFTCGPLMAALERALPPAMRGGHAADSAALLPMVLAAVRPGDVVMVKGSLGSRMAPIVEALLALGDGAGETVPPRAANGK
jgi:UDP-N-acetylmuramoyl-tripeptide--D-alanyl-D-alanine ligase